LDAGARQRSTASAAERQLACFKCVMEYLQRCYPAAIRLDDATIGKFLVSIVDYGLTDAEVLQVLNLAPCDPVFFHGFCSGCDARFSQEQVDQLCDLVKHHLLGGPAPLWLPTPVPLEDAGAVGSSASQPVGVIQDATPAPVVSRA